jgi:hypothetical protein
MYEGLRELDLDVGAELGLAPDDGDLRTGEQGGLQITVHRVHHGPYLTVNSAVKSWMSAVAINYMAGPSDWILL